NQSEEYRRTGANWTAGSLVFTMNAAPAHDFPQPASVYMNLHRGECRDAHAIDSQAARQQGDFIIAGDYSAWMEVLSGRTSPLVMLTTGRLILKKGSLLKLLPHTRSAAELVNCARRVPWA
ncbi:MAG: Fis family transcriptional regulator, partial [Anaerolineae bacterium]|nr:Fis family transcriptional regulator [Anaerolineae bacterium]